MSRLPKMRGEAERHWRALLSDSGAAWLSMPMMTRAVAAEILRRLDTDNAIVATHGRSVLDAVCLAITAHPRERRNVKSALADLEQGRWIEVRSDRLVAYFPDLGKGRAPAPGTTRDEREDDATTTRVEHEQSTSTTRAEHEHDTTTTAPRQVDDAPTELTPTPDTKDAGRREEKREEERRGEETRVRAIPPDDLRRVSDAMTPSESATPLGRLLGGFRERWSRRCASTWRTPGQHLDRAREVAADFADRPTELAKCLDGFFATEDPFVTDKRWPFKLFLNDPGRWAEPTTVRGRLRPAAHDADVQTEITDDLFVRKESASA